MKQNVKKRKRRRGRSIPAWHWLIAILLLLALYIYGINNRHTGVQLYGEGALDPASSAVVHFIDVGQADAACIVLPTGETLLIDAGSNASEDQLLSYLAKYGIRRINYAVFTHPHEDHIGGGDAVLDACSVEHVLLPKVTSTTATYQTLLDAIAAEGCTVQYAVPDSTYILGDASFTILGPAMEDEENLNNASILLSFRYGETTFLFTGDAEEEAETAALLRSATALQADVIKVGHHGSSTSSSAMFLAAVSPDVAVISCGASNEYGHPHAEVLSRLQLYTEHIFRTDRLGSIRVYSDGNVLWVQSEREG